MESAMNFLGMNDPGKRFIALFTLTDLLIWLVRPPYFFRDDGSVNPMALIPWWAPGVAVGGIASFFL